ncbi:Zinc finger, C2CH-type [Cinara cedri]|uniref:Zinc finger, C2CH-type n=1 Tax=Cinara cedri TaxID=506608 RepID=A0A5E4M3T8_9HEMI|nr:Zinc finger, C2CH-type [Cinara cedri]
MADDPHCQYFDCFKTTTENPELSMFKFPIEESMRNIWLHNSGNVKLLSFPKEELFHKMICELHFRPEDIKKPKKKGSTKELKVTAVPYDYNLEKSTAAGMK